MWWWEKSAVAGEAPHGVAKRGVAVSAPGGSLGVAGPYPKRISQASDNAGHVSASYIFQLFRLLLRLVKPSSRNVFLLAKKPMGSHMKKYHKRRENATNTFCMRSRFVSAPDLQCLLLRYYCHNLVGPSETLLYHTCILSNNVYYLITLSGQCRCSCHSIGVSSLIVSSIYRAHPTRNHVS